MKIYAQKQFTRLPDAILFDMDNTLYAYAPAHNAAVNALREKMRARFGVSAEHFDHIFPSARTDVKKRLKETASSHSRLLYMQRLFEMLGLGSQVMACLDMEQTYWRVFLANAILFEHVRELLDDIRLLGIPVALVTDLTAQIQFRKLIYFDLDNFFPYVVTSEETPFDKPHPTPFALALEKLHIPQESCVWMIGDSPEKDIRGARDAIAAVTLQKIHADTPVGTGDHAPDAAFEQFAEVRRLLDRLNK